MKWALNSSKSGFPPLPPLVSEKNEGTAAAAWSEGEREGELHTGHMRES